MRWRSSRSPDPLVALTASAETPATSPRRRRAERDFGCGQAVDLGEREDHRLVAVHRPQRVEDGDELLLRVGVRCIDYEAEHVSLADLLEGGGECLDELGRQLLDETDRIGEDDELAGGQLEAARGGVERREEQVVGEDGAVRQDVEQGRFTGVRVSDEGAGGEWDVGPGGSPCTALPFDHHQALAKALQLLADEAPVHLDLLLSRTAAEPEHHRAGARGGTSHPRDAAGDAPAAPSRPAPAPRR